MNTALAGVLSLFVGVIIALGLESRAVRKKTSKP
jgi:uncharacterized protein involved in exopolysaccharide biosynthesis